MALSVAPGKLLVAFLLLFGGLAGARAQVFAGGAWSGNVTPTSATVSIHLNAPGLAVRLALSTNAAMSAPKFFGDLTTSPMNGNEAKMVATGLTPNTDYFYGIEVDGVLRMEPISRGKFRTFPAGAASFKIVFASCGDYRDPDQRAYGAILAERPLLMIHTGDFHYRDTNTTLIDDYRLNYDLVLNHPQQGALYRSVPIAYVWDDHDFCGDNSNGSALGRNAARAAYRDTVPHYPLAVGDGTIGQAFTIARVRVIMTDLRSASVPSSLPESAAKTRMGAQQKAWFKQELIGARDAGFPLILWVCPDPWIDPPTVGGDAWGGYSTERIEIANFLRDNRIKNVVILSGDMHALAYDDGTHSDYAAGGGAPLVVLQAAALTREANVKGGPYTAGPFVGAPHYGVLEITDTGGPVVQCRFTGKRVGEGAKLSFQFNASANAIDGNAVITPTQTLTDRALINISARGRIAAPGDTLIAGFVVAGSTSRNLLLRAVGPSLTAFGVTDVVARPALVLFQQGGAVVASNDNWGLNDPARLTAAFDRAGAFRFLNTTSGDAAMFLSLAAGAYTVQAGSANSGTGNIVVEVYEVP